MPKPREASKCREWERDRRDRLKNAFVSLGKLLPCYDPSKPFSKIDVLHKSAAYIEELQTKIKDLLSSDSSNKTEREEIKSLNERVSKLLVRNEQLANLLRDAGITLPTKCGTVRKYKDPRLWSNRITPEHAKVLAKREAQKENEPKKIKSIKKTSKSKKLKTAVSPAKQRKVLKKSEAKDKKNVILNHVQSSIGLSITQTNLITLVTTQSCFIITNAPSHSLSNFSSTKTTTVVTNSRIFSTPLVASTVQPTPSVVLTKSNTTLKSLTSGTLIVANGNLLPVLPQPTLVPNQTIITNPIPTVVNPPTVNSATLIVVPKTSTKESFPINNSIAFTTSTLGCVPKTPKTSSITVSKHSQLTVKAYPTIRPKRNLTRTTQINKVPIPAFTSRYANSFLLVSADTKANSSNSTKSKVNNRKASNITSGKNKNASSKKGNQKQCKSKTAVKKPSSEEKVSKAEKEEKQTSVTEQASCSDKPSDQPLAEEPISKKLKLDDLTVSTDVLDKNVEASVNTKVVADKVDLKNAAAEPTDITKKNGTVTHTINSLCNDKIPTGIEELQNTLEVTAIEKNSSETTACQSVSSIFVQHEEVVNQNKAALSINNESSITATAVISNDTTIITTAVISNDTSIVTSNISASTEIKSPKTTDMIVKTTDSCVKFTTDEHIMDNIIANKTTSKDVTRPIELQEALTHSELSNDIFASLTHVATGGQNPESTSPTAAFLLAFPLVSSLTSLKVTEVMEDETSDSQHGTPTLLQIGTMDTTKPTQSQADNLTPNLLNLDNFSFFSSKDICSSFYSSFDNIIGTTTVPSTSITTTTATITTTTKMTSTENEKKGYLELPTQNLKEVKSSYNVSVTTAQTQPSVKNVSSTSSNNAVRPKQFVNLSSSSSVAFPHKDNKTSVSTLAKGLLPPVSTTAPSITHYNPLSNVSNLQKDILPMPPVSNYNVTANYNQMFYTNLEAPTTTVAVTMDSAQQSSKLKQNNEKPPQTYYTTASTSNSLPQYNTFNPFTDVPKSSSSYTNFSKPYNDANNTNYSYNYYNDGFNTNYNATKSNTKNEKSFYGVNYDTTYNYKDGQKYEPRNQQFNNYYNQNQSQKPVSNQNVKKALNNTVRPPVNWMTTPDVRQQTQTDFLVPTFGKDMDFTSNSIYPTNSFVSAPQTTYFNTNTTLYPTADLHNSFGDTRKMDGAFPSIASNTFQRTDMDENQFTWSPSKLPQLLDPSHNFVSGTLPTLVGDLALGNTQPSMPFIEQKVEINKNIKDNFRTKDSNRHAKPQATYDNQSNFLSVSQLVDHSKTDGVPSRISNRRNSGNRSSKTNVSSKQNKRVSKPVENKEPVIHNYPNTKITSDKVQMKPAVQMSDFNNQNNENNSNWIGNSKNRITNKNPPSSYSAEALIGHQSHAESVAVKQRNQQNYPVVNKSLPVPFLTDNIIPYFPPVDLPQDNTFMQQSQSFQNSTFTGFSSTIQNNVYSSGTFVPTTPTITLSSTNFIPDIGNHDFNTIIPDNVFVGNRMPDKQFNKNAKQGNVERIDDKRNLPQASASCSMNTSNTYKRTKRKQTNDTNLPGYVDFSFLSLPGAINSPILPDDFHTHSNFLPPPTPTQLYPCKNPLYPKQHPDLSSSTLLPPPSVTRPSIQHPEISPSLNNVGTTSLTNFNLSTIFPEINKGSAGMPDLFPDSTKNKDFIHRDFLSNTSQVPFTSKASLPMSYINSTSTT